MGRSESVGPTTSRRARERVVWAAAALVALAGVWALGRWSPSSDPYDTVCLLRRTTGIACPGCGMGRAAAALAHGDWQRATRSHPLVWLLAVEAIGAWAVWGLVVWDRIRPPAAIWLVRLAVATVVLFAVVWILRATAGTP